MASISLRNVTKVFDRRIRAISGLSLEVADGEFLVLVGPSGCGKTTVLRLIAGLETPTAGEIRIRPTGGISNCEFRDSDLGTRSVQVAMVFQDGVLYPHFDVFANLAFPLRMRRQPEDQVRRRVETVAGILDLKDLLDRKPAALSGGQRQRVALGRALVREPAVFLLDEPLSSLDAALRLALRAQLKALHQRLGATMLYVTHDQSEAMALGERIGVLRDGRLQQVGPPDEIYERPANRFVAAFFGTPPMNFLTGRIQRESDAHFLIFPGGRIGLSPAQGAALANYKEDTVVAGIRPHDLSLTPPQGHGGAVLRGRVVLVEPLGARVDVHVELPSGPRCVVSASPRVRAGVADEVSLCVDPDRLHLFECAEPGRRISQDPAT